VHEQRVTNLLQSLLLAVCLGATPAIQRIPTAVLWGYFVFMAVESLAGSQLWERLLMMMIDPQQRVKVLQQEHAAYLQVRLLGCRVAGANSSSPSAVVCLLSGGASCCATELQQGCRCRVGRFAARCTLLAQLGNHLC
jgi:hypothetical protein